MKRLLGRLFVFWFWVATALPGLAQRLPYNSGQRASLGRLQQEISTSTSANYRLAVDLARQRKLPLSQVRSDGTVVELQGVDERGHLLYTATHSATRAGVTTRTSALYAGGGLGLALSGGTAVLDKLGFWDGGRVLASHAEFGGRVTQVDNPSRVDNHATHVAGILVGAGLNNQTRGMAPAAQLRAWDFSNDRAEMVAAAPDLLVSNHSYGSLAGWNFNPDRAGDVKWEWYGDTTLSSTEDFKFGWYSTEARDWDRIAFNAPYYLIVKSAGNSHGQNGPAAGQPHYLINRAAISRTPRGKQNGYDQIATYGGAKNILTVGSITALTNGYLQPSDLLLSGFSSWGPTDDGRIKPDMVGVGARVLSSASSGNAAYQALSGTSMSSPNVAGSLLLLQEYHAQRNGGRFMRSASLKGLAIHTAEEAGDAPGPDYRYGWGLLNAERAARFLQNADRSHQLLEQTLEQGKPQSLSIVASGNGPLVVTLCWTDPEGTPTPSGAESLNNRTPKLVNDLDIRLAGGGQSFLPWVLDPANPASPARTGDNTLDNVEQIRIENPIPGATYVLTLNHKGTLRNNQQDFSLLISGGGGAAYCASTASAGAAGRISQVRFGSIDQGAATSQTAYVDRTSVSTPLTGGQRVTLSVSLTSGRPAVIKAFIDWNSDGDFTDAGEAVATSESLRAPATFNTTVTAPAGRFTGQATRLRIVAVEATDAQAVQACGTYAAGETQDYTIRWISPQNDVGVTAVTGPDNDFCSLGETAITLRVRNFGTLQQRNIPLTARLVAPSGTVAATLSSVLDALPANTDTLLTLRGSVQLQDGVTYRIDLSTALSTDQNETNNTASLSRSTARSLINAQQLNAFFCDNGPITLRSNGGGVAFWYDAPAQGNLVATGNQTSTSLRRPDNVYYVGVNDFVGSVGPAGKQAFGGGTYAGNFGPQPLVTTQVPLLLEKARLYIGSAGRITFTVRRLDDTPVSSVSLNVTPTRNPNTPAGTPPSGQQSDDPNDTGAEYALNLAIPEAGTYKIGIEYSGGATIFRSNEGVSGFPFTIPGIISLRGALFNQPSGAVDTLTNAYYYLYDLRVRSLGCPVAQRIPVPARSGSAIQVAVSPSGAVDLCRGSALTLQASPATGGYRYQWLFNGQPLANATGATLAAANAGTYAVEVTGECSPVTSTTVAITLRDPEPPRITRDGYILTSTAPSGNQWLLNGMPIAGATGRTYTARQSGRYAVRANFSGCGELVSEELTLEVITALPAEALAADGWLRVFPRPADRLLTVEYHPLLPGGRAYAVRLLDARGVVVQSGRLTRSLDAFTHTFDLTPLPAGVLVLVIEDENGQALRRETLVKR